MAVRAAVYRKKSDPLKGKDIDYKNKKMLEGYVTERGKIIPSRISGVSQKNQRKLATAIKRARNADLLAVQAEVGLAHHQSYIGQTVEVLVEGPSPRANKQPHQTALGDVQLLGRTRGDHIVVFDGPESLTYQYVNVTITGATALTLFARKVTGDT